MLGSSCQCSVLAGKRLHGLEASPKFQQHTEEMSKEVYGWMGRGHIRGRSRCKDTNSLGGARLEDSQRLGTRISK